MQQELSPEALSVLEKVKKLLALAGNNDNEHQAAAASAKAMELLAAHNLSISNVEQATHTSGKRENTKLKGGLYEWQREVWGAASHLNFCIYRYQRGLRAGSHYEHQIWGRVENVIGAQVMAEYLQQTIERLAREYAKERGANIFSKPIIAFREGMAYSLRYRLYEKRRAMVAEAKAKRDEEAAQSKSSNGEPGTALILGDVIQNEDDLNNDFYRGYAPGTTAKWRAEMVARQHKAEEEVERMLREQQAWDLAHPEEARKRKAKEAAEAAKAEAKWNNHTSRRRQATDREKRRQSWEFSDGYRKADDISLDKQIDENSAKRIGRGK